MSSGPSFISVFIMFLSFQNRLCTTVPQKPGNVTPGSRRPGSKRKLINFKHLQPGREELGSHRAVWSGALLPSCHLFKAGILAFPLETTTSYPHSQCLLPKNIPKRPRAREPKSQGPWHCPRGNIHTPPEPDTQPHRTSITGGHRDRQTPAQGTW